MQVRVDESETAGHDEQQTAVSPVRTQVARLERAFTGRPQLRAVPSGS
jgi:hypothetical protein